MKIKITNNKKDYETLFVESLLHSYDVDTNNENLTEEQLNENKFFDMVKWKLAKFSLKFVRDDSLNQILQAYYSDKNGNPTEKSKSVKDMSKKQKLEVLTRLADNIPDEQKRKIMNSVPANTLSKKIKKENIVALGTSATVGGVASAVIADSNLDKQKSDAMRSSVSKKNTTIYNLENKRNKLTNDLNNEKKELDLKLKDINHKIDVASQDKEFLEKSLEDNKQLISSEKIKNSAIQSDITAKEAEIARLEQEIENLNISLDSINEEIKNIEAKYDSQINNLNESITKVENEIKDNNLKIQTNDKIIKDTDVKSQQPKITELEGKITTNNGLITTEGKKIEDYEGVIERLKTLKGQINELSTTKDEYKALLEKETLWKLDPRNYDKNFEMTPFPQAGELDALEVRKNELDGLIKNTDTKDFNFSVAEKTAIFFGEDIAVIDSKINSINSNITSSENIIKTLNGQNTTNQNEITRLGTQLEANTAKIETATNDNETLKGDNEILQKEVEDYKDDIKEIEIEKTEELSTKISEKEEIETDITQFNEDKSTEEGVLETLESDFSKNERLIT
jgi:chromosome segregation ATPase